ncbi:MAG: extracellular solute-binding protein [Clostridia bacterium]|nr:extracellular solute-binding protein [Clostridia bacterium]
MTRKLVSLLLALCMLATLVCVGVAEDEDLSQYRITDEDVTIILVRSDNSNQPMQLDSPTIAKIQEITGVKLEIQAIAGSDFTSKTEMIISTNQPYDIMYDCYYVAKYAGQDAFLNIDTYLNEEDMPNLYALFTEISDLSKLYIDGALYQIPVLSREAYRMGRSPQIRQDLLAETGMDAPATWDELYEVLLAIKEAHPEVYPIGNRNGTGNLFTCYAYPFGTGDGVYWEPEAGEYVYGPLSEEYMTLLQWLADAYADGILDPDYAVATSTQWQERLASGQNVFFYDNPTFATNFNGALASTTPGAYFGPIEVPASGDTQRGLYYSKHDMGATVINANTQYPEICCKLMDFLYSDYGCTLTNFGIEGESFEYNADGEPEILASAVEAYMTASDPMRAFFGKYALAKLGMARYIDDRDQDKFVTEEAANWYATWGSWAFMDEPVLDPAFTTEENEELSKLKSEVNDVLSMSYDDFIMGNRPVEEWTQVQDQIRDSALRICEIYNAAAARAVR